MRAIRPRGEVDAAVARLRRISAPTAAHYLAGAALAQKISELAYRSETQARDVFDAHLLLSGGASLASGDRAPKELGSAIERAMSVSYDEFVGQVVAYLEPEHRDLYASREAWNQMQAEVVAGLEALA